MSHENAILLVPRGLLETETQKKQSDVVGGSASENLDNGIERKYRCSVCARHPGGRDSRNIRHQPAPIISRYVAGATHSSLWRVVFPA